MCRYGDIENYLWCCGVRCSCTYIAWKTYDASPFHKSCPVMLIILGSAIAKRIAIGDVLPPLCWYVFMCEGKYGVGPLYSFSYPLFHASQLIGKIFYPCIFVFITFY